MTKKYIKRLKNTFFNALAPGQGGFTLIELIIAVGLTALFIPALVFVFSFSLGSASQGESYTQAYALAQENMEAIYYLKENDLNWDWDSEPSNTMEGEFYQPEKTGSDWILGSKTSSPIPTDGGYTITVKILPVNRLGMNISDDPWSALDPYTRKVVVNVSWNEKGIPTDIDLVSYVSRH